MEIETQVFQLPKLECLTPTPQPLYKLLTNTNICLVSWQLCSKISLWQWNTVCSIKYLCTFKELMIFSNFQTEKKSYTKVQNIEKLTCSGWRNTGTGWYFRFWRPMTRLSRSWKKETGLHCVNIFRGVSVHYHLQSPETEQRFEPKMLVWKWCKGHEFSWNKTKL